jgi:hypothetical protein
MYKAIVLFTNQHPMIMHGDYLFAYIGFMNNKIINTW